MGHESKPIYGYAQYLHLGYLFCDNQYMDISQVIASNLTLWMDGHPSLSTLKKLAAKSGVGFGTVQRAKNGNGNVTIQNLELIAGAFGRKTIDLLMKQVIEYDNTPSITLVHAKEPDSEEVDLIEGFRVADPGLKRAMITLSKQAKEDFGKRGRQTQ